jgi:ABC-type multidrug transport system permease subunit
MPLLSVWAVRLALGYLTVGALLGTLLLAARAPCSLPFSSGSWPPTST